MGSDPARRDATGGKAADDRRPGVGPAQGKSAERRGIMTFRRVLRAWDRFLFRPVSPVPIAVYRIAFGTLIILNLLFLLPDLNAFYGEQGMLPMADAVRYLRSPRLNVLAWL